MQRSNIKHNNAVIVIVQRNIKHNSAVIVIVQRNIKHNNAAPRQLSVGGAA